jgi:hypothetical protein
MALLEDGLSAIVATGVTQFLLPFLLLFTFSYVTLKKSGLFGKRMQRVSIVVAFSLSLMATRFVSTQFSFTSFISKIVLILIGLFFFQFILALVKVKVTINDSAWFQVAILIAVLTISLYEFGVIQNLQTFFATMELFDVFVILLFFGVVTAVSVIVYRAPIPHEKRKLKPIVTEETTNTDQPQRSERNEQRRPSTDSTQQKPNSTNETTFDQLMDELRREGKGGADDYNEPRRVVETDLPPKK